jgi:hypothetical protein
VHVEASAGAVGPAGALLKQQVAGLIVEILETQLFCGGGDAATAPARANTQARVCRA